MKKVFEKNAILFQVIGTALALIIVLSTFVMVRNQLDDTTHDPFYNNSFEAVYFPFLVTGTIVIGLIAGLPIRIFSSLRNWWQNRPMLAISIAGLGAMGFVCTLFQFASFDHVTTPLGEFTHLGFTQPSLVTLAWLTMAFGLLHIFPSKGNTQKSVA